MKLSSVQEDCRGSGQMLKLLIAGILIALYFVCFSSHLTLGPESSLIGKSEIPTDNATSGVQSPSYDAGNGASASTEMKKSTVEFGAPSPLEPQESVRKTSTGECDILAGDWVPNPSGPLYTNETCPFIEGHQDCLKNGRPDLGFLNWKWSPRDCKLQPFNATGFIDWMRNKTWAFIGDSVSRNHVQSLLCMLSTVEVAVEIYHDEEFRSKTWRFLSHNLTISNIWSPFLVEAAIFEDYNGVSTSEVQLHLDKIDKNWTVAFKGADYAVISAGQWFLKAAIYHKNGTPVGCHLCHGRNITEVGFAYAYKNALRAVFNHILSSKHKGAVFFRTSAPVHFEGGDWYNGGACRRTKPAREGEVELKEVDKILHRIEIDEFSRASFRLLSSGVNLKLLNFTGMLLLRPDGHPGPYRFFHPFTIHGNKMVPNDCLHWCLPGPIDYLNDIIMHIVLNS